MTLRWIVAVYGCGLALAQDMQVRTLHYHDLSPAMAKRFDAASFDARIRAIERDTARREREGELDHLIYYALQSQRFTELPRIEPALSARELVESSAVPSAVRSRLAVFVKALGRPNSDERMRYFARVLPPAQRTAAFLELEYRRAMRFLYDKEFLLRDRVYETRGHSTDTQVEANYAVWNGLSVLKQLAPGTHVRRVLIVGPGLDFAPRTALFDAIAPQSFQPYAVADALLSLGLARSEDLTIDCGDINDRVLNYIRNFPQTERRLELYSEPGDAEYDRYFRTLGDSIGRATTHVPLAPLPAAFLSKTLQVDARIAHAVHGSKLNILTGRWPAAYDLVVVTNVLVYFDKEELALALTNIASMLTRGSILLHNELRADLDELSPEAGLEPVQARTVRVTKGRLTPLYDAFAMYRRD